MTNEEKFVNELIGYIFAYPDDDYMTMECLCRKLHKYGLIDKADGYYQTHEIRTDTHECVKDTHGKTENSSEKPNNCEDAENPSGDVWECGCFPDTYCEHQIYDMNPDGTINIVECGYEPKTEPQTNADQHVQHVGSVEPTWTKEEHEAFYTFLWNVINPNEMQDYIEMFETKDEPQKWEKPPKFEHEGIITTCVTVPMALIETEPQTESE